MNPTEARPGPLAFGSRPPLSPRLFRPSTGGSPRRLALRTRP